MEFKRIKFSMDRCLPVPAAAAYLGRQSVDTAVDIVHEVGSLDVLHRHLLITRDGDFTKAAVLGKSASEERVEGALQLWEMVSRDQVAGYVASSARQHHHARDLVFTTVACVAAWVHAEGLMEPMWVGADCPQQSMSLEKLVSWQSAKAREVRPCQCCRKQQLVYCHRLRPRGV